MSERTAPRTLGQECLATGMTLPELLHSLAVGSAYAGRLYWLIEPGARLLKIEGDAGGSDDQPESNSASGEGRPAVRELTEGKLFRLDTVSEMSDLHCWLRDGCQWLSREWPADGVTALIDPDDGSAWRFPSPDRAMVSTRLPTPEELRIVTAPLVSTKVQGRLPQYAKMLRSWLRANGYTPGRLPPYKRGCKDPVKQAAKKDLAPSPIPSGSFDKVWHHVTGKAKGD